MAGSTRNCDGVVGSVASAGTWALTPFRSETSLQEALPRIQRRLAAAALLL
jgi:hypothetical protein